MSGSKRIFLARNSHIINGYIFTENTDKYVAEIRLEDNSGDSENYIVLYKKMWSSKSSATTDLTNRWNHLEKSLLF